MCNSFYFRFYYMNVCIHTVWPVIVNIDSEQSILRKKINES